MNDARWHTVEELFQEAVVRPREQRSAFLREASDDSSIRSDVEALLASDDSANGQIDRLVRGVAVEWAVESASERLIGQKLGRYEVQAPLGSGGMGDVYLAHDSQLGRKVALKLLPPQFTSDADRLRRFEKEARAASALNHPNILTVYEIGEWEGTRFIATEFTEGDTLREYIARARFSIDEIVEIGCQTCSALAAAHAAGIIHRDVKPANIMLRADGYVKVLDFGLAKLTSAQPQLDVTEAGRILGTINYMSPEQAMGQPLDHRSDIFSLGVVLYELTTGRRLFDGQSEAAVYNSILNHPPPAIRSTAPDVPEAFDQVVHRALMKDPAQRYQSADDLRADLRRLAQGKSDTEAGRLARIDRTTVRRRQLVRLAAAAAVLLALTGGAMIFGGRFEARTRLAAEAARKSIAVLPFTNLGRDDRGAVFADGIQDQVLTDLARIEQLKVIGRTSVLQYKADAARNLTQIGQELGVSYLLEGSVQRVGDRVRVNARLMDARGDQLVWAESYERKLADIFDIQQEIATSIATRLANLSPAQLALVRQRPTTDLQAFELYTRGRQLLDLADASIEQQESHTRAAIDLLTAATQRDPAFLSARIQLARGHDLLYWTGIERTPERLALARAAVDAAANIAPAAGESHLARASHLYMQRDFPGAERELAAARGKLPNNPSVFALAGYMNRRQGRVEEAVTELETAAELDPRNPRLLQELAICYLLLRDQDKGAAMLDRAIAVAPDHLGLRLARAALAIGRYADTQPLKNVIAETLARDPSTIDSLAQNMITVGLFDRDFALLRKGLDAIGDGWYGADWAKFPREFGDGMLARLQGDEASARKWFEAARVKQEQTVAKQPEFGPALSVLGVIHAALGNKEEALRLGRRGIELVPQARDALTAPHMAKHLAIIAGWVGEHDLAIELLRPQAEAHSSVDYGQLVLDPIWDPLRSDPRFQEIVTSLSPNGADRPRQ